MKEIINHIEILSRMIQLLEAGNLPDCAEVLEK